jgi:hypothetical protein
MPPIRPNRSPDSAHLPRVHLRFRYQTVTPLLTSPSYGAPCRPILRHR